MLLQPQWSILYQTLNPLLLQVSDTDEYSCVAQNAAGFDFASVKLDVYVLPNIVADFQENTIAVAGEV